MAYFAFTVGHLFLAWPRTDNIAPPLVNFLLGTFVSSGL